MIGGTFTPGVEKVRPGIYFNFELRATERITSGERGRAALPVALSWGEPKKIIEISSEKDALDKLGVDLTDPSMKLVREAKKNASTVLVYRVNEGEKATATIGTGVTATAKYGGSKGNDVTIRVSPNVTEPDKKDVVTYVANKEVDRQTVATAEELTSNNFVVFSGAGELNDTAGTKLTGGTDGEVKNEDYIDFLSAAEAEYFDTIGLPVDIEELKVTFASFVRRLREDQGYKVQGVLPNYEANYEGIINVTNGVVLSDGTSISTAEAVAWVAGASAGATLNQSLTFKEYESAVDVYPKYDHDEIVNRLKNGEFLFSYDSRDKTVSVESDINSLIGTTKLSRNKIVRIMDAIQNDITRSLKDIIKSRKNSGQDIPGNADGIQIVQTAIAIYMNKLQENGVIKNFDQSTDISITLTEAGNGFNVKMGAQPVDSAEKFYFTVEIR